jgi:hypothetical protein
MTFKQRLALLRKSEPARLALFGLGCLFLLVTPLVGPIPGPGGIVTFGIGMGLVLQNSQWAKKRYVAFKKRSPKAGSWADWSLRRQSAKRRDEKAKREAAGEVGGD